MKMKHFLSFVALLLPFITIAQKSVVPEVKVVNERNANPMVLQDLSVDILVVGQTAVTTMEMTFYNPNSRIMEGEFQFPLSNGQEVSRFALDINGKMREGVVVDKALGRKAFEDIVRRGVDPGLLEKTEGNNFKARVYPMPVKGTRKILIAFEQELHERNGQDYYFLPIASSHKLNSFKVRTEVVSRFVKADIQNSLQLDFRQARNSYLSEVSKSNFTLDKNIALTFPKIEKPQVITATNAKNQSYFYGNIALGNYAPKSKSAPKQLEILWDASHSAEKRDINKELAFLDAYFKEVKNMNVTLTTFNIRATKPITFQVEKGNWQALKEHLENLTYDGATDGNAMMFDNKANEVFLFTDGIFNFGSTEFNLTEVTKKIKVPVSVINSSMVANTPKMQYVAGTTGGSFIDLTVLDIPEAIKAMSTTPFQLLNVEVKKGKVNNIFPQKGTPISKGNFTLAGELLSNEATLLISFGYHNKTIVEKELTITANTDASKDEFDLLRRIWAEKQIAQLQREGTDQKKIDAVGREYGIVTEGNSLIVLETVEDYVRYRITPPDELQQEYSKRLGAEQKQKENEVKRILDGIVKQSEGQTKWWETEYPIKGTSPKSPEKNKNEEAEVVLMEEIAVSPQRRSRMVMHYEETQSTADVGKDVNRKVRIRGANNTVREDRAEIYHEAESLPAPTSTIELNTYNPDTPYLKVMEYTEANKAVETYYKLKREYGNTPSFYVDVADYFYKKGNREQAILVISNLAELGLDDPQLLRMLGYKLSNYVAKKEAIQVFRKVAELREEEPQSFRDLGLALADDAQYNEAVKQLYKVITNRWSSRFGDVQLITMNDINSLVMRHKGIDVSYIDKRLLKKEPVEVRVVLSWDTDSCDMDLWVTDPKGEKCYFQNTRTYLGGKISYDVTQGYGPEEFMLKKAEKGKYKVQVNYYGTRSQKQLMPVSLRITFFTHYGTPQQKQQETTVRLSNAQEVIDVGSFEF